jgi:hypothetical protein
MSEFNKEASIVGQNAGSTAASLMAAYVASGANYGTLDDFLADYNAIRTDVMNGSIALAGAEGFIEAFGSAPAPAPARGGGGGRSFGGGNQRRSSGGGGGGNSDPSTIEVNFGKYRGVTLGTIQADDPEYLDWLEENANSDWLRNKVTELKAA